MDTVSIITPLYKGKKYLPRLASMIGACAENARGIARVEWVISNDDPKEAIGAIPELRDVRCVCLETDVNRGIQGTRVRGLQACCGECVLFLDQDDAIHPMWIASQLPLLGDADAVVCQGTKGGKPMYGTPYRPSLQECMAKEYILFVSWAFFTGQTLIRRSSIPALWEGRWLHANCCDDYYLWICMYAGGCKFQYNPDVLYDHSETGENQSLDMRAWCKSTHEMMHIICGEGVLDGEDRERFAEAREREIEQALADVRWNARKMDILDGILGLYEGRTHLDLPLPRHGGLAVYGYELGCRLALALASHGFPVDCVLDYMAGSFNAGIPVYTKEETPLSVRYVINTLASEENKESITAYYRENRKDITLVDAWELFRGGR